MRSSDTLGMDFNMLVGINFYEIMFSDTLNAESMPIAYLGSEEFSNLVLMINGK